MLIDMREAGTKGGQGIRTIISLMLLKPFAKKYSNITISNIRYDRPKPGLHDQLLQSLECIYNNNLINMTPNPVLGLTTITLKSIDDSFDKPIGTLDNPLQIKSRGSVWLILQNFILPVLNRKGYIIIEGNTTGPFAPTEYAVRKLLEIIGLNNTNQQLQTYTDKIIFHVEKEIKFPKIDMKKIVNQNQFDIDQYLNLNNKSQHEQINDQQITEFDKDKKLNKLKFNWQIESLQQNGISGYVQDQILPFIVIQGGQIYIQKKTYDSMDITDPHMLDLENLFKNFGISKNITEQGEQQIIKQIK